VRSSTFPTASRKFTAFVLPRSQRAIGGLTVADVTQDDCKVFLTALRCRLAASIRNKCLQLIKAMSAWGTRKGFDDVDVGPPHVEAGPVRGRDQLCAQKIKERLERRLGPTFAAPEQPFADQVV